MPKKNYCFPANFMQGGKQMKHGDGGKLCCGKKLPHEIFILKFQNSFKNHWFSEFKK